MTVVKDPELSVSFIRRWYLFLSRPRGTRETREWRTKQQIASTVVGEPRFQKVYPVACLVSFRRPIEFTSDPPSGVPFVNAPSPLSRSILRHEKDIFASPTSSSEFKAVSSDGTNDQRGVYSRWRYTRTEGRWKMYRLIGGKIWKRVIMEYIRR